MRLGTGCKPLSRETVLVARRRFWYLVSPARSQADVTLFSLAPPTICDGIAPPAPFLDPSRLLDSSRPLPRISLTWWAGAGFIVVVLVTLLIGNKTARAQELVSVIWAVATLVLMGSLFRLSLSRSKVSLGPAAGRADRRAGAASAVAGGGGGGRSIPHFAGPHARVPCPATLVCSSSVLGAAAPLRGCRSRCTTNCWRKARLTRRSAATAGGWARAMAIVTRRPPVRRRPCDQRASSGSRWRGRRGALVEIYRDVKTGHPAEAAELFEQEAA